MKRARRALANCTNAAVGTTDLVDPRKSQVVELRVFGGLNVEETAEVLKVSLDTVVRDWSWPRLGCSAG